jgi:hypothetical protein
MTTDHAADLVRKEAELIESGMTLQTQGLDLLLAEIRALAGILTGTAPASSASEAETEAATEAGFDNMPV